MATQGLVTVRNGEGVVIMKVIAGIDGMCANALANVLKSRWPLTAPEAHAAALGVGFGSEETLVVSTQTEDYYVGDDDLSTLYRETFDNPTFNPRWKYGIADHTVIISV